ncbi:MAG TPA: heparan-alpha-glucosaminide N-acetyltransferase domain-containing protein, partial [Bacteroidota bacterium]|nr:heparan-alpha-glucosaminide N-acetyltransferase domain-containing protein [Bacteroidota bacterium]
MPAMGDQPGISRSPTASRLMSLDVFRGATIAGMILVNNPGDWQYVYPPFRHSAWNGWTYTDTIFPFFLWIVGVAMTFSFSKRLEHGQNRTSILIHVLQRVGIIIAIGLFLNGFPFGLISDHDFSWDTMRIPGVLQRIAICYLFSSVIFLFTNRRWQLIWTVILLVGYWILVKVVPVPGYGCGVLIPKGSLCWYVDSTLFGGHTWSGAPVQGFDPEGIVSTIPAIATTMFGILTGTFLRSERNSEEKAAWMFVAGCCLMFIGTIVGYWLPVNKNMWTSSYSVFMAGLALNVFAISYWIIDVKGFRKWSKPFEIYGLNAISLYVLSELLAELLWVVTLHGSDGSSATLKGWYYQRIFLPLGDPMVASFLHSLV